jgi:hypothetical protein
MSIGSGRRACFWCVELVTGNLFAVQAGAWVRSPCQKLFQRAHVLAAALGPPLCTVALLGGTNMMCATQDRLPWSCWRPAYGRSGSRIP